MPPAGAGAALPDTGAARTNHSPVSGRPRSPGDPQTMEPAHRCIGGWTAFRAGISLSSKQNNDERPVGPGRAGMRKTATAVDKISQCRTGRRNVGQSRCHDQDQDQDHDSAGRTLQLGLPAAPGEAGEQGERGPQSTPGLAPPAGQCSGNAAAANAPVVPVANHAVAQDRGAGHAGALLPRPELNGNAALFPAPSCAPAPVAGTAAPSSDDGFAPQLLPPTHLPVSVSASALVPAPVPVVVPSESRHTASRAPESSPDDPFAELSPGPLSAAPLLHPQRQRELIEQAAGMRTRQVAGLLAAAAPEVVPPRDTLRAVAPDRYTLKVTIDQECEQGLRLLKDLMSHLDPRMSWGDLVARLVGEAVAQHDPRGGGSGQRRRRSADSAGASPRRTPNKTPAAGAPAGPAQGASESSRRTPSLTRATGAAAAPAQRGGGDTPAPQGDTTPAERQKPSAMAANAAAAPQSAPAALSDGARAGGVPAGAPAVAAPAAAAPQFAGGAAANGADAGAGVQVSPFATGAPERVLGVYPDGGPSGASAGAAAHTTRDSVHRRRQSPPRRHIPAAVRRHVWHRDGGRCCYRDPLTGRRCTSSHLLQIDHLLPVAHHSLRHGHGSTPPPERPM